MDPRQADFVQMVAELCAAAADTLQRAQDCARAAGQGDLLLDTRNVKNLSDKCASQARAKLRAVESRQEGRARA